MIPVEVLLLKRISEEEYIVVERLNDGDEGRYRGGCGLWEGGRRLGCGMNNEAVRFSRAM